MFDHDAQTTAGELLPSRRSAPRAAAPPTSIDDFEIVRVLGEGGMGTVYLATQRKPKRLVALKVIRPGCATPGMLRRFEVETETLGRLQHPGIARIYEAGTIDIGSGRQPFFAMEYIEGRSLDEVARDLGPEASLGLVADVARAVHHAHQRGVIHRDLKPANILVDGSGQVKILDFGVARAIDADVQHLTLHHTGAGQLVGTVPYMSPEQIDGDPREVDTRSDVYALGVIAYEVLTGRLPYDLDGRTLADAARVVRDVEATSITRVDRSLRGDVETIVHTALEKDRERRYASASDLASDIDAWRRHQPISARPPSAAYQLRKFTRRHWVPVGAACTIFVVSIAASVVSTVAFAEARAGRTRAEVAQAEAGAISDFLIGDLLSAADPSVAQGREFTVREAVDVAADRLDHAFADQPAVRRSLHETLGTIYAALADFDRADAQFDAALGLVEDGTLRGRAHELNLRRLKAIVMREAGDVDAALAEGKRIEREAHALFGPSSLEGAEASADYASILVTRGEWEEAEARLVRAVPVLAGLLGRDHRRTLVVRHNLATALTNQGRIEEGLAMLRSLLDARRAAFGDRHPDTLSTMNNIATALTELGRYEESEPLLREIIALRAEVLGPEHPSTLTTRSNLVHILLTQQRWSEAEPLVRENLAAQEATLGRDHQLTLITLNHLGYLLEDLGRPAEARTIFEDALQRWRDVAGPSDPNTMIAMNNLAMLLQKSGNLAAALMRFEELVDAAETHLPEKHHYWAIFANNHGDCLTDAGRYAEAEAALRESHAVLESVLGAEHERVVKSRGRIERLDALRASLVLESAPTSCTCNVSRVSCT